MAVVATEAIWIDNRKDVVLLLLLSPGTEDTLNERVAGRTRLMKLVYLFYKEVWRKLEGFRAVSSDKQHRFIPFHFGPFSKDLFDDIVFLENVGLVREQAGEGESSMAELWELRQFYEELTLEGVESDELDTGYREPVFSLTDEGVKLANRMYMQLSEAERRALREFKTRYSAIPLSTLLRYVYKTYPDDAAESKIRGRF